MILILTIIHQRGKTGEWEGNSLRLKKNLKNAELLIEL